MSSRLPSRLPSYIEKISAITNLAKGILPTVTGWTVAPTSLANATDESLTTVTGEGTGQIVTVETNNVNEVTIDLGSPKAVVRIIAKVGMRKYRAIGSHSINMRAGELDTLSDELIASASTPSITEVITYLQGSPVSTSVLVRYISLRSYDSDSAYGPYLKVYEVLVFGY